jgi:hypothetical protein
MDNTALAVVVALLIAAFVIDAIIPERRGSWKSGPASAQDVARIVGGAKPPASERVAAKFALLIIVIGALWTLA